MKHAVLAFVCLLVCACAAWAQDNQPAQDSQETITVPKSDLDALKAKVDETARELQELKAGQPAGEPTDQSAASGGGGKQLALPDISLIVQAEGKAATDNNDPSKQKLQLTEAELGVQGYVYPNVKADAFITMSPSEHEAAQVEEAYLTYLGLTKGLNIFVGQKFVPFDRVNQLHNHSWLYTRQPLALTNFVAPESLAGQGAYASYLLPTRSGLFAQLDLGTWANGTEGAGNPPQDFQLAPPLFPLVGPGADVTDRFSTARLWTGFSTSENGELELGGSWLGGKSNDIPDSVPPTPNRVHITGVDLTYRHFGQGASRLLLRGESLWRKGTEDSSGAMAGGYYLFGDYRWNKYGHIGLLYDWTEFPQDVTQHESALSLILTRQFSEQYYLRLQLTQGSRPDDNHYTECWLQWCWGVGPHTHNLE